MGITNEKSLLLDITDNVTINGHTKDGTPIVQVVNSDTDLYEVFRYMGGGAIFGLCMFILKN